MRRFARPSSILSLLAILSAVAVYACTSSDEKPKGTPETPDAGEPDTTPADDAGAPPPPAEDGSTPPPPADAGPDAAVSPIANASAPTAITPQSFAGFADGPIWIDNALFFSDVGSQVVVRFTPPNVFDEIRSMASIAPRAPIGTTFDAKTGVLLTAESESSATPTNRIARWFPDGGAATPSAVAFDGGAPAWHSPNDVVVRPSDGTIYVTDPGYQSGSTDNAVFRIAPGGGTTVAKAYALGERPNGVALSPDASTLYVSLTVSNTVVKFAVAADGTLGAEQPFASATPAADGLGVDQAGNVYVTTSAGVSVFSATGHLWGSIATAKPASGVAFGGADKKTLYITADGAIYAVTGLEVAGLLE